MLVVGTVAAMILTQKAREEGPVAYSIPLKTKPGRYRACFRMTRDDTVDVAIVDAGGDVWSKILADDQPLRGDRDRALLRLGRARRQRRVPARWPLSPQR